MLKKNIRFIFLLLTMVLLIPSNLVFGQDKEIHEKIILIDPGHGGQDGGAQGKDGTIEKEINLTIAQKLKVILEGKNYKIFLTREEDKSLHKKESSVKSEKIQDLNERCRLKEETNCQVFISIHLNSFPKESAYGPQVWYGDNNESKIIAQILQKNLLEDLKIKKERQSKEAKKHYKILRNPSQRAEVIVECGFMSNHSELAKLKKDDYQQKIAESIAKSIDEYYEQYFQGNVSN